MRALAATSVLVFHVWQQAAPGGKSVDLGAFTKFFDMLSAGVALFFVLSGFLLFRPYVAAAVRGLPTPSMRAYLLNRLLRIGPAYITIVAVVILFFERGVRDSVGRTMANVFLVEYYVPGYVAPELHRGNGGVAIVPSWSVAVEVVFYLLVPLLGFAAIRTAARRGIDPVLAALGPVGFMVMLGIAGKITSHLLTAGPVERVWNFSFLPHADWFAWGMALALLRVLWEDGRLRLPAYWRPSAAAATLVVALVAVKLYYSGVLTRLEAQSLIAFGCSLLLALVVLDPRNCQPMRLLCSRPVVAAGLASYSLFLWHDPLLRELRDHGLTEAGRAGFVFNLMLIGAIAGAAATLTYLFVEKPALARKRVWQRAPERGVEAEPMDTLEAGGVAAALSEAPARAASLHGASLDLPQAIDLSGVLLEHAKLRSVKPNCVVLRDEVCRIVSELAPDRADDIAVAVPAELEVSVDRSILGEILAALIRNALLYGRPPVAVAADVRDGSLQLTVEDHGRGVLPEFVPHLFEPYSRSETSSAEAAGAGLGLAMAQAYAGLHAGKLHFEPVQPHGAAFHLVLPVPADEHRGLPTASGEAEAVEGKEGLRSAPAGYPGLPPRLTAAAPAVAVTGSTLAFRYLHSLATAPVG